MRRSRKRAKILLPLLSLSVFICAWLDGVALLSAQQMKDDDDRAPRFLMTSAEPGATVPVDVSRTPALTRRISVTLRDVTLEQALRAISRQGRLEIAYSRTAAPLDRTVRLDARDITVAAALTEVLLDAQVDVVFSRSGRAMLVTRKPPAVGMITGRVTNTASGEGIPGANVRVQNTGLGTTTNAEGRFRLMDVPVGDLTLVVDRLGYGSVSRPVTVAEGAEVTVDIVLELRPTQLDELVVTTTGQQRRLEVGHATATIRADSVVANAPIFTFTDLLQGRVAGLRVLSGNGSAEAGRAGSIRIRGLSSFTLGNDPVIVIDGVRVDNQPSPGVPQQAFGGGFNPPYNRTSRLLDVNPQEIESIEVVRGPAAGTLYGTDAANGVIVVQTKRGRPGPARWAAFLEYGRLDLDHIDFGASYYSFGRNTTTDVPMACPLRNVAAGVCTVDSISRFSPLDDPELNPLKPGPRSQYGVQVSGGTGGLSYFFSAEYEEETGPYRMPARDIELLLEERGVASLPDWQIRPNHFQRYALRANMGVPIGSTADLVVSTGFTQSRTHNYSASSLLGSSYGIGYRDANDGWGSTRPAIAFAARSLDVTPRFVGSVASRWRPAQWLDTRATVGVDLSAGMAEHLQRRGEGAPTGLGAAGGGITETRAMTRLYSVDLGATATSAVTMQFTSRTSVGIQYNRQSRELTTVAGRDFGPGAETVAGTAIRGGSTSVTPSVVGGAFLQQEIGYGDRLFLTGALRADGASTFGADFSTAVYPKASLSWVAIGRGSERPWIGLNSLRVRLAYGESGVQPGAVDALLRFQSGLLAVGGIGMTLASLGNPELGPERSGELEAGLDAEAWDGRVRMEATVYQRLSRDAIVPVPLGPEFGDMTRFENVGAVRNRGLEGVLSVRAIDRGPVNFDVTLNGSLNQNRLLTLPSNVPFVGGAAGHRHVVGYPIHGHWQVPLLGFEDRNNDGVIEPSELMIGDTAVFLGSPTPTRQLTVTPQLGLLRNALNVSAQLDYQGGHVLRNHQEFLRCRDGSRCRAANDPGTPLVEQARAVSNLIGAHYHDAGYVQLREVSTRWTLPTTVAARVGAESLTVSLAARNLTTWTNWPGITPEQGVSNPDASFTTASITQPPARTMVVRLTATF